MSKLWRKYGDISNKESMVQCELTPTGLRQNKKALQKELGYNIPIHSFVGAIFMGTRDSYPYEIKLKAV